MPRKPKAPRPALTPAQAKLYERLAFEAGTMGPNVSLEIWPDEVRQANALERLGIIKPTGRTLRVKMTTKGMLYFVT